MHITVGMFLLASSHAIGLQNNAWIINWFASLYLLNRYIIASLRNGKELYIWLYLFAWFRSAFHHVSRNQSSAILFLRLKRTYFLQLFVERVNIFVYLVVRYVVYAEIDIEESNELSVPHITTKSKRWLWSFYLWIEL